ncbi:MAG: MFS transporter [Elusimicrobiota bacterium]
MPAQSPSGKRDGAEHPAAAPRRLFVFFIATYVAQGFSGIAYEPVSYLLKNNLGLSAGQSAIFIWWMTFPFLIKPLFGILSDLISIGSGSRRSHIMAASSLAAAAWMVLSAQSRFRYAPVLGLLMLVNVGMCSSDVVCEAVMVEQGQAVKMTGVYQAIKIGALYAALVATGIGGGWLYAHLSLRKIFALTAIFPALIFASSFYCAEKKTAVARARVSALKPLLSDKAFWTLALIIFLWSFYPFLGTAQFYYQSETLKLGPVFIGSLVTISGIFGFLAAIVYGRTAGEKSDVERRVKAAVILGCPLSMLYAFYIGPISAVCITVVWGFVGVFFRLTLMDLAARLCPPFAEATGFAIYMTAFNLAETCSNTLGGKLYDILHPAYAAVLILSAIGSLCTMACWWLLPGLNLKKRLRPQSSAV